MTRITRTQALANQRAKQAARLAARNAQEAAITARLEDATPVRCMCGSLSTTHIAEDGLRRTDCCGAH